ncbi:uncharacterized protein LOC126799711 [Argentina anserina]|uniref:uncharacterized protein LOC126799711 n=1 Tax=Argentina anserina TaxID=57926 RepID=UPI0021766F68|nr:uncharacterized protein LOC126799711 [Potentilla anserina]
MQTLHFKTQPFLSIPSSFFINPISKTHNLLKSSVFASRSHLFRASLSLSDRTQTQKPIVNSRKNRRANGSVKLQRFLLRLVPIIASSLKLLPQPLDLVLEEIGGGGGGRGGLGFWKSFGGGGFDGFRSKRKRKLLLLFLFYGVLVSCGYGLLFGGDLESNVLWFGLCFGAVGVGLVHWWEMRGLFGAFVWGVLVGSGFKRKDLRDWGLKLRPMMENVTLRSKRSGRRAF